MFNSNVWPNRTPFKVYISPSLSGLSQQRPPSLMWPQTVGTSTMNVFTSFSLSPKATSLIWPQFLGNRVALLEGDHCNAFKSETLKYTFQGHPRSNFMVPWDSP